MNKTMSAKFFKQSQKVLVGGVNSPVRAFKSVGGSPLIIKKGKGAYLFDVDGYSYVDYCLSWGSLILGHAHQSVTKEVKVCISLGTSFGATTKPEIEIAHFITKCVPSIEMIRFVNSGTEATMSAIRVARGFTKRTKIIKFDGCYHGHCDDLLAKAGSGVANLPSSTSLGVIDAHIKNTMSLPYNDINILTKMIERYHKDIACVILEPVAGNMGVIIPQMNFLKVLRDITKKYGIVLIFDEVMSGFRTNLGGAQKDFNIIPDLTCLGKIIGAGFPVGAYGGRRDIMQSLSPIGNVYQAGTFSGNPIVMKAGLTTLKELTPSIYKQINRLSDSFSLSMNQFFRENNSNVHFSHYKSMISLRFTKRNILNYHDALSSSSESIYSKLFHFLLNKGVYLPPADLETFFISTQHTEKNLLQLSTSIKEFFKK